MMYLRESAKLEWLLHALMSDARSRHTRYRMNFVALFWAAQNHLLLLDKPVTKPNTDVTLPISENLSSRPTGPSPPSSQPKHSALIADAIEAISSGNAVDAPAEQGVFLPELEPSERHPPTRLPGEAVE